MEQALEKYLKAFLLANGWELEKTDEISALLKEAIKYKPELGAFADLCKRAEDYYFAERYPSTLDTGISFDEVAKDFEEAKRLRELILEKFAQKPESTMEEQTQPGTEAEKPSPSKQNKSTS